MNKTLLVFLCLQLIYRQVLAVDMCPGNKPAIRDCTDDEKCKDLNFVCTDIGGTTKYCCAPNSKTSSSSSSSSSSSTDCKDQLEKECKEKSHLCKIKPYKRLMVKFCNSSCFQCKKDT